MYYICIYNTCSIRHDNFILISREMLSQIFFLYIYFSSYLKVSFLYFELSDLIRLIVGAVDCLSWLLVFIVISFDSRRRQNACNIDDTVDLKYPYKWQTKRNETKQIHECTLYILRSTRKAHHFQFHVQWVLLRHLRLNMSLEIALFSVFTKTYIFFGVLTVPHSHSRKSSVVNYHVSMKWCVVAYAFLTVYFLRNAFDCK